jgi:hypothetical protein
MVTTDVEHGAVAPLFTPEMRRQLTRWFVPNRGRVLMKTDPATLKRVYAMSLAGVYPHYVAKAEKKGRTKAEVDEIIRWLTGYTQKQLESILEKRVNIETFISKARMNPSRTLVTGSICGVRVEDIEEPVMQGMRYLDKLIDELAKGRPMDKILRKG